MTVAMILAGILTIISAAGVVASSRPIHSALFLIVSLFMVAVHFALLGAHFVAAIQILVYAGAIMVLVVFVIMLLGAEANAEGGKLGSWGQLVLAIITGGFVAVLTSGLGSDAGVGLAKGATAPPDGSAEAVAQVLFTRFALPFNITGLLLLAALIGAVLLAAEARRALAPGRGLKAMQDRYQKMREEELEKEEQSVGNG
jgi:NADH-quinone oxidoreductase subunit J